MNHAKCSSLMPHLSCLCIRRPSSVSRHQNEVTGLAEELAVVGNWFGGRWNSCRAVGSVCRHAVCTGAQEQFAVGNALCEYGRLVRFKHAGGRAHKSEPEQPTFHRGRTDGFYGLMRSVSRRERRWQGRVWRGDVSARNGFDLREHARENGLAVVLDYPKWLELCGDAGLWRPIQRTRYLELGELYAFAETNRFQTAA